MILILLGYVLGFSISISILFLLIVTFGSSIISSKSIVLVFLFFAISQLTGIFSFYRDYALFLVYLFEMLAFLSLYYRYLRTDLLLLSIPLIVVSDAFLVISLYFVLYDFLIFIRRRGRLNSGYIILSFCLFMVVLVISLFNDTFINFPLLTVLAVFVFDIALILFLVPIFKSLMRE